MKAGKTLQWKIIVSGKKADLGPFLESPCYFSGPLKALSVPWGTPYNGLYWEAPPERGTFFRLQVYKRVGISQVEVYKREGKSVI